MIAFRLFLLSHVFTFLATKVLLINNQRMDQTVQLLHTRAVTTVSSFTQEFYSSNLPFVLTHGTTRFHIVISL